MEKLKIQSFGDIITNSSSEVFVIKSDDTYEEVEKIIKSWNLDDNNSGMGGDLEVYDGKRPYVFRDSIDEQAYYPWVADGYLVIHIDWAMKNHIDRIFKDFNVVGSEECDLVYNKETDTYRLLTDDDRNNGIKPEEQVLLAGNGEIMKMQKEYHNKLMNKSEDFLNKTYGMEEAKKIANAYNNYIDSINQLDYLNAYEKEYEKGSKKTNKDLHSKYKNHR